MLYCKKLAVLLLIWAVLAPLSAKTRKGDRLLSQGRAAEAKKQYDVALDFYEQALSEDPSDTAYQLAAHRVRFQAGQAHVERGLRLRAGGNSSDVLG
jgi:general secretion pathway protein D